MRRGNTREVQDVGVGRGFWMGEQGVGGKEIMRADAGESTGWLRIWEPAGYVKHSFCMERGRG